MIIFWVETCQAKLPTSEIANTINEFRTRHLSELTEVCFIVDISIYIYQNLVWSDWCVLGNGVMIMAAMWSKRKLS